MAKNVGLTVGYDAKRAVNNVTGLGNYSRLVIGSMAALYPQNTCKLFAPRLPDDCRIAPLLAQPNVEAYTPRGMWKHVPALWRTFEAGMAAAEAGCDIYHGLSNEIPLGPLPCASVVTIHDLIWRRVPQDYSAVDRRLYDLKYGMSARRATRVIAISECTRRDLISDWNINPDKIDVIYQGCDPAFTREVTSDERRAVREKYNLPERFVVAVGTVESRKNQLLTVRAMEALPTDVGLVVVGRPRGDYGRSVRREVEGLGSRALWLDHVPFADLPALYSAASAAAYTSRYEGFGLPVVEAISCSTPVVACTGSCLEEAGGKGAVYVDPDDVRGCAEALSAIIEKPYVADRLRADGRRHIKRFNPTAFAEAIQATYLKAILDHELQR